MSKELKHKIHLPTDCLSEKMLFDYIDNKLTPKEQHVVEKHLLDCELCSDALEGLEITKDRSRIKLINDIINKRLSSSSEKEVRVISFNYKLAVSIAATIALLVIGVFFFNKISLKEADLAELNKDEAHPATSPSPEESTGKLLERWDSVSPGAKSAQDEPTAFKTVVQEPPVTTADSKTAPYKYAEGDILRNNTGKGESANEVPMDATLMDDRESVTALPEESVNLPQGGAFEREENSKSDAVKGKAEEKSVAGNAARWASPQAPDQNQTQNNNSANQESQKQAELLAKKSTKKSNDNKYRSESKKKGKEQSPAKDQSAAKERRADQDMAIAESDKNVGHEPKSLSQTTDEVKSEVSYTTTTKVNGLADSLGPKSLVNVDIMPEFIGGQDSLMKFISRNFNYDKKIDKQNPPTTNKIYVRFTVTEDGSIKNPVILKGINTSLDNEALKVVKMMPKWKPASRYGKAVSFEMNLPIKLEFK